MAKDMQKQITLLVALLVIGFLVLGSVAPQTMAKLNDFGAKLKLSFFKEQTSNIALGYVTLVVEPPAAENEEATR